MTRKFLAVSVLLTVCVSASPSQEHLPAKDSHIERVLKEISPSNIKANIAKLAGFVTRHTLSDTADPLRGIGAARNWIKAEFERYAAASGGRMTVEFDRFTIPASQRVPHPLSACNVVATLHPGSLYAGTPNRTIVISGHYDSRATDVMDTASAAPGADDDGSGTALVLELARVLGKEDVRATIEFICFTGEEQGLFGSTHWASMAKERGLNIEAVFNNDIVGNIYGGDGDVDSTSVRVFSEAFTRVDTARTFASRNELGLENDGPSRSLARYVKEIGELYVQHFNVRLIYRKDRFLRGGDQIPFQRLGIAAVRFSEAKENFDRQHQNVRSENGKQFGDVAQFVDPEYCAYVARVNCAAALTLALAPTPPSLAHIVVSGLSYDTRLQWNRNHDPALRGYLVRWRETSAPVWQHTVFTPDTSVALRVSKDDYLFAVQAVDGEGHSSMYSIPVPTY